MGGIKNKKNLKRLTLEDIISAKEKRDRDKLKVEEIEIPSLEGTLVFKRPSDELIFDMIDALSDNRDTRNVVDEMAKIIYACCDQLHEKELYEEFDVGDPVDIVFEVMDSGDIIDVGDKVCSMNSLYQNAGETVKNG